MSEKDQDHFWNSTFNPDTASDINQEHAEAMLKRLEKKAMAQNNKSFSEAIGDKVWRTRDGRYINISAMDDNHLMNSYRKLEDTFNKYFKANRTEFTNGAIKDYLDQVRNEGTMSNSRLNAVFGDQVKAYRYLHEEIVKRNLFQKKLSEEADSAFDVFNEIINSKPDDNDT